MNAVEGAEQERCAVDRNDLPADVSGAAGVADLLSPLLQGTAGAAVRKPLDGVAVGELVALTAETKMPLVRFADAPGGAAVQAQSTVDLHGAHIGANVVLVFEHGDPARPIVLGVIRGCAGWPMEDKPAQVDVDADGHRMIVSARQQLVLRCGKASITLTRAGKVLIEGSYLLSRSTGVNRIKGGSVQLN
jgi:hypothetical protein